MGVSRSARQRCQAMRHRLHWRDIGLQRWRLFRTFAPVRVAVLSGHGDQKHNLGPFTDVDIVVAAITGIRNQG